MNKRQTKKRDKKLYTAIKELNDDVAESLGEKPTEEEKLKEIFHKIKKHPEQVNRTCNDYYKFILVDQQN